jgi:cupin superfamily acireductone dioxygenase involved in methionine salvage
MNGVKIYPIKLAHSDSRRDILEMFNGDFNCKQVKVLKVRKYNILGNHYHTYREIRYLLKGKIQYYLKDINTGIEEQFIMNEGDIMITESYIAHTGEFLDDSIIIEGTEEEYIDAKHNDVVYKLK